MADALSREILTLAGKRSIKKPKIFDSDVEEEENAQEIQDSLAVEQYAADLMGDEGDRAWLHSLPELEREAILFERSEKRRLQEERMELKKKLEARNTVLKQQQQKSPSKRRKEESEEGEESEESDIYSEEEDQKAPAAKASPNASFAAKSAAITPEVVHSVSLTRNQLEQLQFRSSFQDTVVDCFVRVASGSAASSDAAQSQLYRFAQVHTIAEYPRPYRLNQSLTRRALVLQFGASRKTFRLDVISNSPATDREVDRWKQEMQRCSLSLPSLEKLQERASEITRALNAALTDDEITAMVKEKQILEQLVTTPSGRSSLMRRTLTTKKIQIQSQLEAAREEGNLKEAERLEEELAALLGASKLPEDAAEAQRSINRPISRIEASGEHDEDVAGAFARRRCNPTIIHATQSEEVENTNAAIAPVKTVLAVQLRETSLVSLLQANERLAEAHNFSLDFDREIPLDFESVVTAEAAPAVQSEPPTLPDHLILSYNRRFGFW